MLLQSYGVLGWALYNPPVFSIPNIDSQHHSSALRQPGCMQCSPSTSAIMAVPPTPLSHSAVTHLHGVSVSSQYITVCLLCAPGCTSIFHVSHEAQGVIIFVLSFSPVNVEPTATHTHSVLYRFPCMTHACVCHLFLCGCVYSM